MKVISGIQQLGIGVSDVYEAWKWYRQNLGFDIPVIDDPGRAEFMLPYTGGKPQDRHAVLTINLQGGGGLEIWQYMSRTPQPPSFEVQAGDLGIYIGKIKTRNAEAAYKKFKSSGIEILGDIVKDPEGKNYFFIKDPYKNVLQIVECDNWFGSTKAVTGGALGAIIGVSDMDKSIEFYKEVLGYDRIVYDVKDRFADFEVLPGGENIFRRVLLTHSKERRGPFSRILGTSYIELIQSFNGKQRKIFENRFWGDLGFIHLCYDVQGMGEIKKLCEQVGCPFTVDSNPTAYGDNNESFEMGEASGHFTYTEDPDGALIEFVEAHRIAIVKKLGWYLNLKKRDPEKPLPNWMIRSMSLNRKKD